MISSFYSTAVVEQVKTTEAIINGGLLQLFRLSKMNTEENSVESNLHLSPEALNRRALFKLCYSPFYLILLELIISRLIVPFTTFSLI